MEVVQEVVEVVLQVDSLGIVLLLDVKVVGQVDVQVEVEVLRILRCGQQRLAVFGQLICSLCSSSKQFCSILLLFRGQRLRS